MTPVENYWSVMKTIRGRFDVIANLKGSAADGFPRGESAAFQGRKIVEGIAFGCLVAVENGLSVVPKDAKGKWNAEDIFKSLKKKGLEVLPSPSTIRDATDEEARQQGVKAVIEGQADRRLSHDDLIEIYQRLHGWAHELNPYTQLDHDSFYAKNEGVLWQDLNRLERFVERHFISIRGKAFFCSLRDLKDGKTKVMSLSK